MRVLDCKSQLIDELVQIAGHASGDTARRTIKARLHQLAEITRLGVLDGWSNLAAGTKAKLDDWLEGATQSKLSARPAIEAWEDEGGAVRPPPTGISDEMKERLRDRSRYESAELGLMLGRIRRAGIMRPTEDNLAIVRGVD